MEAKKCDRCGKLYEYTPVETKTEWYDGNDSIIVRRCDIDGNERYSFEFDLCPDCKDSFDNWINAGCIVETAPAEAITTAGAYALVDAAKEAEAQRVRVGEYWQNNATGTIVKITDADEIEVHFKGIASGQYFREGADYFKKKYTKKGGAE